MKTFILLSIFFAAAKQPARATPFFINCCEARDSILTYQIIPVANHRFGYDIYSGSRRIIQQPTIPGRPGNNGFTRKEDAKKVASLVIKKMRAHDRLPTITLHEMDSLRVIY